MTFNQQSGFIINGQAERSAEVRDALAAQPGLRRFNQGVQDGGIHGLRKSKVAAKFTRSRALVLCQRVYLRADTTNRTIFPVQCEKKASPGMFKEGIVIPQVRRLLQMESLDVVWVILVDFKR